MNNLRVKVYWNLHKKCWSIQHKGKVIKHVQTCLLNNAVFKVSEAGRQRVIKEKRKNVHAFVVGDIIDLNCDCPEELKREVSYNPYKHPWFYFKRTMNKVEDVSLVFCGNKILLVK